MQRKKSNWARGKQAATVGMFVCPMEVNEAGVAGIKEAGVRATNVCWCKWGACGEKPGRFVG